jgi:abortive infection bacteriophage resistance protein
MRRLFGAVLAVKALYHNIDKWNDETYARLKELIASYSPVVNLRYIGFPVDWESWLKK